MKCKKCGQHIPTPRPKRVFELKRELGELLELTPKGYNIDKEPYFDIETRTGLINMIDAVKKLKDKE